MQCNGKIKGRAAPAWPQYTPAVPISSGAERHKVHVLAANAATVLIVEQGASCRALPLPIVYTSSTRKNLSTRS